MSVVSLKIILDSIPPATEINNHGIRVAVSGHQWDGDSPVPGELQLELLSPPALNSNISLFTRNAELSTHSDIQIITLYDATSTTLRGVIIRHHGPLAGPLFHQ